MLPRVRNNVFETNSSSTHTVSLTFGSKTYLERIKEKYGSVKDYPPYKRQLNKLKKHIKGNKLIIPLDDYLGDLEEFSYGWIALRSIVYKVLFVIPTSSFFRLQRVLQEDLGVEEVRVDDEEEYKEYYVYRLARNVIGSDDFSDDEEMRAFLLPSSAVVSQGNGDPVYNTLWYGRI